MKAQALLDMLNEVREREPNATIALNKNDDYAIYSPTEKVVGKIDLSEMRVVWFEEEE